MIHAPLLGLIYSGDNSVALPHGGIVRCLVSPVNSASIRNRSKIANISLLL